MSDLRAAAQDLIDALDDPLAASYSRSVAIASLRAALADATPGGHVHDGAWCAKCVDHGWTKANDEWEWAVGPATSDGQAYRPAPGLRGGRAHVPCCWCGEHHEEGR